MKTEDGAEYSQNTRVAAVRVTGTELFGLYTDDYYKEVFKQELTQKEISSRLDNFKKGRIYDFHTTVSSSENFQDEMTRLVSSVTGADKDSVTTNDYGFFYTITIEQTSWLMLLLPYLLMGLVLIGTMLIIVRASGRDSRQAMSFGKSRARLADGKDRKTFRDVQGCEEEKEQIREIVDFLKDPSAFTKMGARIPKGVLLVGPPGTGKTLLAKAVAGEANVPFLSISGSDFVEMFVGVGASRVRDLFATAKRLAPSLVFIDEIDAVGRQRGAGLGGGHDEKEQTLNQLLVEMDGFDGNQGVIVIAATNRPDVLDPALLRPGRFDRQITVDYPDVKGREAILRLYAETKPMADDVDLEKIAKLTPGMTGADLENILNEAAILATRRKLKAIDTDLISEAMKRVTWGPEKKSRVVTPESKFSTATHEVGHAIVMKMLPNCDPIDELSVIQRGRALGYTSYIPSDDRTSLTKGKMLDEIAGLMGGRMAEAVRLSDISTGAQNDLKRATELAKRMVTEFGMSEKIGPVFLAGGEEVFIGREWGHQPNYSEAMAADIDAEVRRILEEAADRARRIIEENADAMTRVIDALVEHEHITGSEFDRLLKGVDDWQDKPAAVPAEASFEAIEKAMTELPADADHAEAPEEDDEDAGQSGPEEEKGSDV
ncbi:MAG: ATP-dependent zinc metalloprotease FtsH [Clostridia bacterium]|nr:ATP-dependent zinc metalloprotease FtsH [Clostridia bacterium]